VKNTGLSRPLPPLETLRAAFLYSPETGSLTWRVAPCNGVQAGDPAGCADGQGYVQVELNGRRLKAHRVAWALYNGADPGPLQVDHINRVRSDNRAANLRLVTPVGNRANSVDNSRPVQVYGPGPQIRLFPSTQAAADALGCSRRSIYSYARGLHRPPEGVEVTYAP
jgi:hypothetical protein